MQTENKDKMEQMLKRSEFEIACTLKGVDVLVPDVSPDDIRFEGAEFLMLQTGNLVMRSRLPTSSPKVDPYFYS